MFFERYYGDSNFFHVFIKTIFNKFQNQKMMQKLLLPWNYNFLYGDCFIMSKILNITQNTVFQIKKNILNR
jgi:hypothetical protein